MSHSVGLKALFLAIGAASSFLAIDIDATGARPKYDLPRAAFCGALLTRSDWDSSYGGEEHLPWDFITADQGRRLAEHYREWVDAGFRHRLVRPWPAGYAFAGPVEELGDDVIFAWRMADGRPRRRLKITGERAIREQLKRLGEVRNMLSWRKPDDPAWMNEWALTREYRDARFAHEVGRMDEVLTDFAAGRNLSTVVLASARLNGTTRFLGFLAEAFVRPVVPAGGAAHVWHVLYFDQKTRAPVWRLLLAQE